MGLSAGQARLLSITARLTDNEYRSQRLTNARLNLSSISEEARVEYQKALDAQKFVYMAYNNAGNPEKTDLTPTVLYQYQPMKNQYALVNNTGQLLVTSEDAKNFESSANLGEFLNCYGLLQGDVDQLDKIMNMEAYETDMEKYQAYLDRLDTYNAQNPELDMNKLFYSTITARAQDIMGIEPTSDGRFLYTDITNSNTVTQDTNADINDYYRTALKGEPYNFETILKWLTGDEEALNVQNNSNSKILNSTQQENFIIISQNLENRFCNGEDTYINDKFDIVLSCVRNTTNSDKIINGKTYNPGDIESLETTDWETYSANHPDAKLEVSTAALNEGLFWGFIIATQNKPELAAKTHTYNSDGRSTNTGGTPNNPNYSTYRDNLLNSRSIQEYIASSDFDEYRNDYISFCQLFSDYKADGSIKTLKEKVEDIQEIYKTLRLNSSSRGSREDSISMEAFDLIGNSFRNMVMDFIEGDVGNLLPKPTYVEEPHKPQVYTEDKEKCQWYINLWYRMNGSQDSKELMKIKNDSVNEFNEEVQINQYVLELDGTVKNTFTSNYKVIPKEIATSKDWLNNVLSQGIVSMEKVGVTRTTDDGTLKWSSIIYSNATDIIREEDSNAIAHAEAKYTATVNEVEIKDKKYQMELRNLDTEHNALQTEYNSVKSAVDENIKRSFKVFQG